MDLTRGKGGVGATRSSGSAHMRCSQYVWVANENAQESAGDSTDTLVTYKQGKSKKGIMYVHS